MDHAETDPTTSLHTSSPERGVDPGRSGSIGASRPAQRIWPAGSIRAPGRIIVIGADNGCLSRSCASLTSRQVDPAANLYEAIGELVQSAAVPSSIRSLPDAIIVSSRIIAGRSGEFVRAVRRLDPAVRLIVMADPISSTTEKQTARAAAIDGFDACIEVPVNRDAFEQIVSGIVREHTRNGAPKPAPSPPPRPLPPPSSRPAQHHHEAAPAPPTSSTESSEPLGDIDLARCVMDNPDLLASTALRLIAQETGWGDLSIEQAEPSDRPGAPITDGTILPFGFLSSGRASGAEALLPWAKWLATWLALDQQHRHLRELALTDDLTGAFNRRFFESVMPDLLAQARAMRHSVSLLVFDIDDFKQYNDQFGHAAGDEILIETVRLLRSVIRPNDRVCRIGGDEFVVIFHDPTGQRTLGSTHPDDIQSIAQRFQNQISRHLFPKLGPEALGTLTISGGLATFPWDGADTASLLEFADRNALTSKRSGKNVITFGPGVEQVRRGMTPAMTPQRRSSDDQPQPPSA